MKIYKDQPTIITEKIQTNGGEITVNLNLNITLSDDGKVQIKQIPTQKQELEEEFVPKTNFIMPDFGTNTILSNFGEDV